MRDFAAILEGYVDGVLSGRRRAGRMERLACERHRRDMDRAAQGWRYVFDWVEVARVCTLMETMRHVEGDLASAGASIMLDPWQVFVVGSLHGWLHADGGARRFRVGYVEVARKNGKTTVMAPLAAYHLTMDGEAGPKVYSAAAKMKQARLVFDIAARMMEVNEPFRRRFNVTVQQHAIRLGDRASLMVPLEAKKLDGLNPHFAVCDELHEHPDGRVWNALRSAMGARSQPLLIAITTAGYDTGGICYQVHDYTRRVLEALHEDDSHFGVIYAADPGDDPMSPETWEKANPGLGTAKRIEAIEADAREARGSPQYMGEFLRKQLCVWTSVGAAAIDIDGWRAGFDADVTAARLALTRAVTMGVDLSKSDDMTAVVAVAWEGPRLIALARHFVTEDVMRRPGNEHLDGWARDGRLIVCPGAQIDFAMVEEAVRDLAQATSADEIAFDPHFGADMMQRLAAEGLPVTEMRQTPMNLDLAFDRLMGLARDGLVVTDGDPVLTWQAGNLVAQRAGEFIRPAKLTPAAKIDGVVAIITAMARMAAPAEEASVVTEFAADYRVCA